MPDNSNKSSRMLNFSEKKETSVSQLTKDLNVGNLGDIMGLEPPEVSPKRKVSVQGLTQNSKNTSEDLASLVGLETPEKNNRNQADRRDADEKTAVNIFQKPSSQPRTPLVEHRYKKGLPFLWMLYPEKYPQVAENFRSIRNKLNALKENNKFKIFLLAGAHENAGVSTITFNLALTLAFDLVDKQILLVDTNLSKPSLHSVFGYPINPGLMDYLLGIRQLEEIIQATDYPNLQLIPSGTIDHLSVIPFDLESFSFFLQDVRKQFDFVLIDAAPVLKSNQTLAIASKTDGVILVAEANRTRWEVLSEIKQQLENNGANLLGSVLNKRRFFIPKLLYRII